MSNNVFSNNGRGCNCDNCRPGNGSGAGGGTGIEATTKEFSCKPERRVIKHQHIVKYRHDIVNEYDVIHEHEYNYYDVVTNRSVRRDNDNTSYKPNYCPEGQSEGRNCGG